MTIGTRETPKPEGKESRIMVSIVTGQDRRRLAWVSRSTDTGDVVVVVRRTTVQVSPQKEKPS